MRQSIYFILLLFCASCTQKVTVFNGEISIIKGANTEDSLVGSKINLEGINTGYMSICDSLMIFSSEKYPDYELYIFNINTGNHIASLCKRGNGPNEFLSFIHREQYVLENNDIKLWGYDDITKIFCLNLTESIKNDSLQIDTIVTHDWNTKHNRCWSYLFMLDDDCFLIKNQPESLFHNDGRNIELPAFHIYKKDLDNKQKTYQPYNQMPFEDQTDFDADLLFYSTDCMKPDKSKIAMGMERLAQINILDLETGILRGFRLENTPDFKDVKMPDGTIQKSLMFYYSDLCADDDAIYALYANCSLERIENYPIQTNQVHVFDWDGNFIKKIILDHKVSQIALDPVKHLLYASDENDDVYCYKTE